METFLEAPSTGARLGLAGALFFQLRQCENHRDAAKDAHDQGTVGLA